VTIDLIVIGVAIALDPLPLTTFLIVVSSVGGVRKGSAFVFGWLVSMAAVVAITILATGNNPPKPSTAPSVAALAVRIALGVGLLLVALRQRRKMRRPKKEKKVPRWQAGVDAMSPWYALALAPFVQPWGLIAAGVATVTQAKVSSAADVIALVLFCIIGTSTYLGLEIYAGFWPERAGATLASIRTWIDTHTDQAIIVGSLVVGFWLIGKSAYLLAAGS
jgi:Sap, sulfolipid-1-addressing protein